MKNCLILFISIFFLVSCSNDESSEQAKNDATDHNTSVEEAENSSQEQKKDREGQDETSSSSNNNDKVEDENKQTSNQSEESNEQIESTKKIYNDKLDEVENSVRVLESKLQKSETQTEMNELQADIHQMWDDALNEIYGVLKGQLTNNEFRKLREEQLNWINERDAIAEEEASVYQGGSLETFQLLNTKAKLTKERCYELVDIYMK
ncbi:lysozyme inhibitor LprI family protein [Bacillus carboniphilus]|uniref:Lysozyme inhibitor LprI family protein n=1 Tax=Bacillus carboniphilus TaxID=86663 RepID=A0ABY9JTM9_9BACI|nr:lysozyme inhibitor LprI family protein [Bacillus carboniphilus]WLR42746.1 lysozyme inhibitor LprI family protein [Bacillus carboniphilus]